MKKVAFSIVIPVLVSACGNPVSGYSEDWQQQKAVCAAGDYTVCSTLGHQARVESGAVKVVESTAFSTPIVD